MTQTTLSNVKVMKFQSIRSAVNRDSEIAQAGPGQAAECRHFSRHLVERTFDAHETVSAGHVMNQLMQRLPFRPGIAARFDSLHELLNAAFHVRECPAFLGVGAARQQEMRPFGRPAREYVADNER